MRKISTREVAYALSGAGVVFILITILFFQNTASFQVFLISSLILIVSPLIFLNYMEFRRVKQIEIFLPDFLRDVAESNRSGMPIHKAIEAATEGHYGPLTAEMGTVASQLSWGIPFEDTLERFAKRINSKLVRQTIIIIVESYRSGGDIADILETVSEDIRLLKRVESERKSELQIYVVSTYFIFFLFLAIIIVLSKSFLPATPQLNAVATILGGTVSTVSEDDFKTYFFHLCLLEAFFAGLISGQMGEGSITAGFKHSFILLIITLVAFQVFLGPEPFSGKIADEIYKAPPYVSQSSTADMPYTLTSSITSGEVMDALRNMAKDKKSTEFDSVSVEDIAFVEKPGCAPCVDGDIKVERSSLIVRKPTKILYSVNAASGRYTIMVGGT